jgi:hypothetical protein
MTGQRKVGSYLYLVLAYSFVARYVVSAHPYVYHQAVDKLHLLQLLNVQVPLFFKQVIDTLNVPLDAQSTVWAVCGSVVLACKS